MITKSEYNELVKKKNKEIEKGKKESEKSKRKLIDNSVIEILESIDAQIEVNLDIKESYEQVIIKPASKSNHITAEIEWDKSEADYQDEILAEVKEKLLHAGWKMKVLENNDTCYFELW